MNDHDRAYLEQLKLVRTHGTATSDRTGTGTLRYPGVSMRFDLAKGFPALTTKKLMFYPMVVELLWFLQGRTDLQWLKERKCNIWNQWHDQKMTIGKGYGHQWRKWQTDIFRSKDQITEVIANIKKDPNSRRHIVTAWNVAQLSEMVLPPCHFAFQFIVIEGRLNCILTQRSGDMFLGVPFNIASYALLTHMIAIECGLMPGILIHNIGDAHVYKNHLKQVDEQLTRESRPIPSLYMGDEIFAERNGLMEWVDGVCPHLKIEEIKELIYLEDYDPHPFIKAPVAV